MCNMSFESLCIQFPTNILITTFRLSSSPTFSRVNAHSLLKISICINKLWMRFSPNCTSEKDDIIKFISLELMKIE